MNQNSLARDKESKVRKIKLNTVTILVIAGVGLLVVGVAGKIMNPPPPRDWVEKEARVVKTEYIPAYTESYPLNYGLWITWQRRKVPDKWKIVVRVDDEQTFALLVSEKIFKRVGKQDRLIVQCLMDEKRIYGVKIK